MPFYTDIPPDFPHQPRRVVSLVPSLTDSLLHFQLDHTLVGVTDYCPWTASGPAPRSVEGTKTPDVEAILALKPDLILADREENEKTSLEALERAGSTIWLTFLPSVEAVLAMLSELVRVFRCDELAIQRLRMFEASYRWAALASDPDGGVSYFCPIWQEDHAEAGLWWMTFNQHTYCDDLLSLCGGRNSFASRNRRYPLEADLGLTAVEDAGGRDVRYPRVTVEDVVDAAPERIFIPDEPYTFSEEDVRRLRAALKDTPAVQNGRVLRVDGRDLTWNGVRTFQALATLPAAFHASTDGGMGVADAPVGESE